MDDQPNNPAAASPASNASSINGGTKNSSPRQLRPEREPLQEFPVDELGPVLAPAARAIQRIVQVPAALAAQSVLAVAALGSQAHADVVLPTGQRRPLSLFLLSVANSGDRKSSADAEAMAAVHAREQELSDQNRQELKQYRVKKAVYEKAHQKATDDAGGDAAKLAALMANVPDEPAVPRTPILTVPEPTLEGLIRLLSEGQPSVGLFSDEGGQFIGGHSMSDHMTRTASGLTSLWDGKPVKSIRKGHDPIILAQRRVSIHLMVQPSLAARLMGDPQLHDLGFLSRFLVVQPDSLAGTRKWRDPDAADHASLKAFADVALALLRRPLPTRPGSTSDLDPRPLPLTPGARQTWTEYADYIEGQLAPDGSYLRIAPLANKAAEHAARIAGIITIVANPEATEITQDALDRGITMMNYYLRSAAKLKADAALEVLVQQAERVMSWAERRRDNQGKPIRHFVLRDVYSSGPARNDPDRAREVVQFLEDRGYLKRRPGSGEAWDIV